MSLYFYITINKKELAHHTQLKKLKSFLKSKHTPMENQNYIFENAAPHVRSCYLHFYRYHSDK